MFCFLITENLEIIDKPWFVKMILPKVLGILFFPVPCFSESCIEIKIKLNFYFDTSSWCLKRFYVRLWFMVCHLRLSSYLSKNNLAKFFEIPSDSGIHFFS